MTYNQAYAKTVTPRYSEAYNREELAIITRDKCQIALLKKRHKELYLIQSKQDLQVCYT